MESFESAKRKKVIWENKKQKHREHEELLEKEGFEPAENRMRKCPRCGRPIVIPRATFCCIGCAIEDKEENDERIKTIKEYEPEDIE